MMTQLLEKNNLSHVTNSQAEKLTKLLYELGLNDVISLATELQKTIDFKENDKEQVNKNKHFMYKKDIITASQKIQKDFTEDHFEFLVDSLDAKKTTYYFSNGLYTRNLALMISKEIRDDNLWHLTKSRCKFSDYTRYKDEYPYTSKEKVEEDIDLYAYHEFLIYTCKKPCVYFIEGNVNGKTMYKIGKTNNLEKRISQLKREYDFELILLETASSEYPSKLESIIHNRFLNERRFVKKKNGSISTEWFDLDEESLYKVIDEYV